MKILCPIALFMLVLSQATVRAQAPVFSQYYSSGLYLNPALAGLEKDIYLGMNYRTQWSNLSIPFNTFQFSFIHPLSKPGVHIKHLGGLGASFLNDVAGPNKEFITQGVTLSGAYNFHMNRFGNNILSVGLQAGTVQQRINYNALQWSSQYDPLSGFDNSLPGEYSALNDQVLNPVLNFGMMWYTTTRGRLSFRSVSAFNGFSISNIIRPNGFFQDTKGASMMLYKVHGGISSVWKRKYEISPNYLIQYQNHNFQFNVGSYMAYYIQPPRVYHSKSARVLFGVWYRLRDAFIFSTGFSTISWNLGFSYDTNVSSMGRNFGTANAYEISLGYKFVIQKGFKRFSSPLI